MRKDAKRVKNVPSLSQILIDLKPHRCDSDVFVKQNVDVTNLVKYMEKKKKENKDITYFHAFVTAIAKTFYNRKKLNYFVANRHLWEHKELVISFVAKIALQDESEELMIMIPISEDDNIDTISEKIKNKVSGVRDKKDVKKGANSAIDTLSKLPNIIRKPVVGMFKWLDDKGMLPAGLVKDNIYYSSIIVSNLGSIHFSSIYHNITNFGTCSAIATIGEIKDEVTDKKVVKKVCDFGINFDERIADGYYFAKSVKVFETILNNPETLEDKVSKKIDI